MEHNNIASIEGENMILCDTDSSASTEFNVPDVETTMVQVSQPMDMEEEDAIDEPQQVPSAVPAVVVETSAERVRTRKIRGPYR